MAATATVFWLVPRRFRFFVLPLATSLFILLNDPLSLVILTALTLGVYLAGKPISIDGLRTSIGVFVVFCVLLGFKILSASKGEDLLTDTLIPLGLSYYSLRCIHYLIERYKGSVSAQPLPTLVAYLYFLPTFFIGPVHRFDDFERDHRRHHWDTEMFSAGSERILYGYVKIVVLGNFLINRIFSEWITTHSIEGSGFELYLIMVKIGLSLYVVFSGYSDIAIGFSRVLGFKVLENFHWPYFKKNISAFWRSWHISLTRWVREYVYTSVFALSRSPALAAVATLVVIGLWHEVSVRYLLWGAYHGLGIVIWQLGEKYWTWRILPASPVIQVPFDIIKIVVTVHFVWLGFLLVRAPNVETMITQLSMLFGGLF